jgi:ketosteroid isomerase-like protein
VAYVAHVAEDRDIATIELMYELWNSGDVARMAEELWTDDVEWHDPPDFPDAGIYVGLERVTARIVELGALLGLPTLEVLRITPLGGDYVVELNFDAPPVAKEQGPETPNVPPVPYVHVYRMREGRAARVQAFTDAAQAFAAVVAANA